MKFFFVLLACLAFFAGATHAEFINGHSYVPLAGWARANGFAGFTLNRGEEIILTNKTARLVFDQDSADSIINGVNVRLGVVPRAPDRRRAGCLRPAPAHRVPG